MNAADDKRGHTTHFGFREVAEEAKRGLVDEVFHSVAGKYDLMNDLMSFGVHRLWKQFTVEQSAVRARQRVLDVAGGTGDMTAHFAQRVGTQGEVVLCDINASMLATGRARLADRGIAGNVAFVRANAEQLPFAEESFDCACIAFGLRNVTHLDRALASMYRCLKPGGRMLVLEFSKPILPLLERAYDVYSFSVLPWLGRVVARDEASYRYLAESIRRHPNQEALKALLAQAGFERVHYFNLTGGIVALHKAYRLN